MRWKVMVLGLALTFAAAVGCSRQCFLSECDYNEAYGKFVPANLACDPEASIKPTIPPVPVPRTLNDPGGKPRYLSLSEAIAIALEQGTTGFQTIRGRFTGVNFLLSVGEIANDDLVQFNGAGVVGSDSIRVVSMNPA